MGQNRRMPRADVTLRPARLDDAETIARYHYRCRIAAFTRLVHPGSADRWDPRGPVDRWRMWLSPDSDFTTTVADFDGTAIGHATVGGAELVHLFVDPDHWGLGLGRTLLTVAEQMLTDAGHRSFELHTMVGNHPAIALYESAGWVMTDLLVHNDQDGVVYDEHVMVKHLTEHRDGGGPRPRPEPDHQGR